MSQTKVSLIDVQRIDFETLPGWELTTEQTAIQKTFQFQSFEDAFQFMTDCCPTIQAMDHHPDWSNTYHRVIVTLMTHDVGGLSHKDIDLAQAMNQIFINIQNKH